MPPSLRRFAAILLLPLATTPALAQEGAALYAANCAPCHGADRGGDGADAAFLRQPPGKLDRATLAPFSEAQLTAKILDGRELPLAIDSAALRARAREVEGLVAHMRRLPEIKWRLVDRGEEIYFGRCSSCHGPLGRPPAARPEGVGAIRDLSDPEFQRSLTDEELIEAVRHGRKGMPALVPRVPAEDGPPLAAYVRLLSPGYAAYQTHCASCHGTDGRPAGTLGEERRLPTVVFGAAYFRAVDADVLRAKIWHMEEEQNSTMPHYRRVLSQDQASAIAAYLLAE